MRILDCKSPICKEAAQSAPNILDFLCPDCSAHFEAVKQRLTSAGIDYIVNPSIVRGLDYYTRTVFEFIYSGPDGEITVLGGGRYGGLVKELGGPDIEGIGFATGLERILNVMNAQQCDFPSPIGCDIFFVSMGEEAEKEAFRLANTLRRDGYSAQSDLMGRSLKAQMKYANKIGARFTMVLGENELQKGEAVLKAMYKDSDTVIKLDDSFSDKVGEQLMSGIYDTAEAE